MAKSRPAYHIAVYCLNNDWGITTEFINSLALSLRKITRVKLDLYLLNNGVSGQPRRTVGSTYLRIFQESISQNLGFAGGHNYLLSHRPVKKKHQLLILANNDLLFPKDFFIRLVSGFEKLPNIFSPILVEPGHRRKHLNLGLHYHWTGNTSLAKGSEPEPVLLSGACLCFSPIVVKEIMDGYGYFFDEGFFSYFEDIELQFRILELGLLPRVVFSLKVKHLLSRSLGVYNAAKYQLIWKNHNRLILLHWPIKTILLHLPLIIIGNLYYPLLVFRHNRNLFSVASMFIFVIRQLIKEIPDILYKRHRIHDLTPLGYLPFSKHRG